MRSRLLPLALGVLVLSAAAAMPYTASGRGSLRGAPQRIALAETTSNVVAGVSAARSRLDDRTQGALQALSGQVSRLSNPDALRLAFHAYFAFRAAHPEEVRKPYLYFVDYGLDSRTPRGYVFDMDALRLVDGPFTVAHGRGSSTERYGVPTHFSNGSGSAASSLGLFLTRQSYGFTGHTGGRPYSSVGLRLEGESGRFNSLALARGVVVHGAPYVTPAGSGRSEGCPAMELSRARRLIPTLADGSLVFLFSPADADWVHGDPWANAADAAASPSAPVDLLTGDTAAADPSSVVSPPSSR